MQQAAEQYLEAGRLYDQKSQYADAYRCYRDALVCQQDLLEPLVGLAYLCKALGLKEQAFKHFKCAGEMLFKKNEFVSASCYFDEALLMASQDPDISIKKAHCIYYSSHPLHEKERVKNAVAILLPFIDKLYGRQKTKIYELIGDLYLKIDPLLAKQNYLNSIWSALDEEGFFPGQYAETVLNKLKKLEMSGLIGIIDEFLQYLNNPNKFKPADPIKMCNDLLALREIPIVLIKKAFFLSGKADVVDSQTYNRYLSLLPHNHHDREVRLLANSNGEVRHPNQDGLLEKIITKAVDSKISWELFHSHVFEELMNVEGFCHTYTFKYRLKDVEVIKIGESDHLLFFSLFNLDIRTFKRLLKTCNQSLLAIRDSKGNTLVHIAACFGHYEQVKAIMLKASATDELAELINSRNQDGTNPLGMLFLNTKLAHEWIVNVAQLFIKEPYFKINSYLNNKEGMDFGSENFLKKIGGLTCLHVALERGLESVLELLKQRNHSLSVSTHSNDFVNMTFPSLNPDHHMNSPEKFIEKAPNKAYATQFLAAREAENEKADLDDSSGDSDDEDAPAFQHKKVLTDLASILMNTATHVSPPPLDRLNNNPDNEPMSVEQQAQLEKEQAKLAVVHFHGVPFMKGHYTNFQRRFVGRKIQEMNEPLTKSSVVKDDKLERLKAIHSRTSTATAGLQTLYDVMTASDEQLDKLEAVDEKLRSVMVHLWMDDEAKFIGALKDYIYNFSEIPDPKKTPLIERFWQVFPERITNIVRYRFPVCSFSKAPDHGVKFGVGENVETILGEERMEPIYNKGKPRHRLVGLLYVTLHSISDIHQLQNHCAFADSAQLRCSGQMKTSASRTDNQLEVSFFGGVSGQNVKVIIPIIYPNFSKGFIPGYHDVVYGLKSGNRFSSDSFNLDSLKHTFVNFALKVVEAIANKEGRTLCYIDEMNMPQLFPTDRKTNKAKLSQAQLVISEGNVSKSGAAKVPLTEITPEKLRDHTYSKQLSSSSSFEREVKARAARDKKDLDEVKRDNLF
jgi:tetratricopeptide (TPR) repeat protein